MTLVLTCSGGESGKGFSASNLSITGLFSSNPLVKLWYHCGGPCLLKRSFNGKNQTCQSNRGQYKNTNRGLSTSLLTVHLEEYELATFIFEFIGFPFNIICSPFDNEFPPELMKRAKHPINIPDTIPAELFSYGRQHSIYVQQLFW